MPGARLSLSEREEISLAIAAGRSLRTVAAQLGRPASTVSREVRRCGGAAHYRSVAAHALGAQRARRPKVRKLVANRALAQEVERGLARLWSPEQIAKRLRLDFPHDRAMHVSHETIYQALFVQGRGALRQELRKALRTGRARRYPKGPNPGRGTRGMLKNMVLISQRPAEVEDRAVPGHWEGDLLIGPKSQIATLVERSTRFVMLVKLSDRSAHTVRIALARKIRTLPEALRRTLTWDQGRELAQHREFTVQTNVAVYFCEPSSPWQRGSNENTNGLLRQYLPKGENFSSLTARQLNSIADSLNTRPRQTLGWMTPSEKFAELMQ